MKVKTSITLDESLVKEMDKLADQYGNRSAIIEQAVRTFLTSSAKNELEMRETWQL